MDSDSPSKDSFNVTTTPLIPEEQSDTPQVDIFRLKYHLLSFIIISPFLLLSLIFYLFTYISRGSLSDPHVTPDNPFNGEKNTIISSWDYSTLLSNEYIKHPLSDHRYYEWIKLKNNLEVFLVSDANVHRTGFSFSVDTSDFIETYNIANQTTDIMGFSQMVLVSNTRAGTEFSKQLRKISGNFKYSSDNKIHWFYCDVEYPDIEKTMSDFHTMLFQHRMFESSINQQNIQEIGLFEAKTEYNKNIKVNTKEVTFDEQVNLVDYLLSKGGSKDIGTSNLAIIRNIYDWAYNNTNNLKLVVISQLELSALKRIVIPIWNNAQINSKEKRETNQGNVDMQNLGNVYLYLTNNAHPTFDIVIPCVNNDNNNVLIYHYISYMMNDNNNRNNKSLFNILKTKGLIFSFSSKVVKHHLNKEYFKISLTLKEGSYEDNMLILQIIRQFFTELLEHNDYEETYNDFQLIYQQNFDFSTVTNYQKYLRNINSKLYALPKAEMKNWFYVDYNVPIFDKEQIRNIIKYILDVSKYSVFIGYKTTEAIFKETTDYHYTLFTFSNVTYHKTPLHIKTLDQAINFSFKTKNEYITKHKDIVDVSASYQLIHIKNYQPTSYDLNEEFPENELWYKYDPCFKIPKLEMFISFHFSSENLVFKDKAWEYIQYKAHWMEILIFNRVKRNIKNHFVTAEESGNTISLTFSRAKGFTVKITCFSDQIVKIVNEWFTIVFNEKNYYELSYDDFDKITYSTINDKFIDYLFYFEGDTLRFKEDSKAFFMHEDKSGALIRPIKMNVNYYNSWFDYFTLYFKDQLKIKSLIYGIIEPMSEINDQIADLIKKYNTRNSTLIQTTYADRYYYPHPDKFTGKCMIIQYNEAYWQGDVNTNFMINALFIGNRTAKNDAISDLLINTYKGIYKNKYNFNSETSIALIEKVHLKNQIFLKIVKKSKDVYPDVWYNETNKEFSEMLGKIRNITNSNFEMMKRSLLMVKERNPLDWETKAEKVWYELYEESDYFDWDSDYKTDLRDLRRIDFIEYSKNVFWFNLYISFQFYADKSRKMEYDRDVYNKMRKQKCETKSKVIFEHYFGTDFYE